jgi:hypothetical protein
MTEPIRHDRAWYSVIEAAQLLGVTPEHLYRLIRKGQRTNPPADAIAAEFTRKIGDKWLVSRAYIFNEPANVTAFPTVPADKQIDELAERVAWRVLRLLGHAATTHERSA